MQAHALTSTHYFYKLDVVISHPIVYKVRTGLSCMCHRMQDFPSILRVYLKLSVKLGSYFALTLIFIFVTFLGNATLKTSLVVTGL